MEKELIYNRGEIKLGLKRMYRLMELINNPQNTYRVVHIAGTNGKGSTGSYLKNMLIRSGLRVGYYQTPAVFDPLEIISVDGVNITKNDMDRLYSLLTSKALISMSDDMPTKFELDTAVAYLYFAEKNCDICVIEAGMGGRTDATNVVSEKITSVITSIGIDHCEYLGNSVEDIAYHKAGIITEGTIVVTQPQKKSVMRVICEEAKEKNSEIYISREYDYPGYQGINAGTAITVYGILQDRIKMPVVLSGEELRKCLDETTLFGRFTRLGTNPDFIIDGAHNYPAAIMLKKAIKAQYNYRKIIFIVGAFSDKEYIKTIQTVTKGRAKIIITVTAPGKRGVNAQQLAEELKEISDTLAADTIRDAVATAIDISKGKMPVVAFGSLSWLREAKDIYDNWKEKNR